MRLLREFCGSQGIAKEKYIALVLNWYNQDTKMVSYLTAYTLLCITCNSNHISRTVEGKITMHTI